MNVILEYFSFISTLSWMCKKHGRAAHLRNSRSVARGLQHTTCRKKHLPSTTHPQQWPAQALPLTATFIRLHSLELRIQITLHFWYQWQILGLCHIPRTTLCCKESLEPEVPLLSPTSQLLPGFPRCAVGS